MTRTIRSAWIAASALLFLATLMRIPANSASASPQQQNATSTVVVVNPSELLPTLVPTQQPAATPKLAATLTLSDGIELAEPDPASLVISVTAPISAVISTNTDCELPVGQLLTETIPSAVSSVPMYAHVYLPPCYSTAKKYPVLYLIHGTAFEFGGWVSDGLPRIADIRMSIGTLAHFVIVMPSADMRAGSRGKYSWTNGGKGSYGDYVVNELLPFIDARYSTVNTRDGRAIGGISRGGYWAIQIALSNPDKFGTLGAHSPSITTKLVGVTAGFSMLSYAPKNANLRELRVWMDAGNADWARFDIDKFSKDLKAKGIDGFKYSVGIGAHEDAYWSSRVSEYLTFYAATWRRQ